MDSNEFAAAFLCALVFNYSQINKSRQSVYELIEHTACIARLSATISIFTLFSLCHRTRGTLSHHQTVTPYYMIWREYL